MDRLRRHLHPPDPDRAPADGELAEWLRCLEVELAAGDITLERYEADAAFYRRIFGEQVQDR